MSIKKTKTQVIFLFSLPRSGSTMAQRILSSHGEISTASEPWILLPYLYTFRNKGIYTEYGQDTLVSALEDFCRELPGGKDEYRRAMKEFVLGLYKKISKKNTKYFLDKTPRYHLVVDDIMQLFPDGKFVLLWRNPLAVIASLMKTWANGKWNLYEFKVDLFDGLEKLINTYEKNKKLFCVVKYEDLIGKPEQELQRVFSYLEVPFNTSILSDLKDVKIKGRMSNVNGAQLYKELSKDPLNKWKQVLNNPIRKAWCKRYLRWIGKERMEVMGYDLDSLIAELDAVPFSLQNIVSDTMAIFLGLVHCSLEIRILKHKLRLLPAWHRIHGHY